MKLILAQGNPGEKFSRTRHNVGFMVVDTYADEHDLGWKSVAKFHAEIAETEVSGEKVLLVKPDTFYNETGRSLQALVQFYKLRPAHDVLVIHDELALPLGLIRVRARGSDAGNNGIKSLNAAIGQLYRRLRIGVDNDHRLLVGDIDFVVGSFSAAEQAKLQKTIIPHALLLMNQFLTNTLELSSHKLKDPS